MLTRIKQTRMTGWWIGILPGLLVFTNVNADEPSSFSNQCATNVQTFAAKGVVKELKADGRTAVIKHAAISNYMDAMTMPFEAKEPKELAGLQPGDEISFRLQVTETESWIDRISKIGTVALEANQYTAGSPVAAAQTVPARHPLLDYKFTNELGQAVSLGEFRGQALAITFFFTRCPVPNFCPRLSKNFQEASQKLSALTGAPTNWHFLSVSFDTEFDTPAVLKVYGESYHYDSKHWNFLTGQPEKIRELARLSGVEIENDGALFNHNFRTMIIDGGGRLQMTFPIGGNLSDAIVGEILKASAVTDGSVAP
jgi:protein SCO1